MKSVFLALALFSANAHANVQQCTWATQNLSNIIQQYSGLIQYCRANPNVSNYAAFQQNARDVETLYGRAQENCVEACSFDSWSASLCTRIGSLEGACP